LAAMFLLSEAQWGIKAFDLHKGIHVHYKHLFA